MNTASETTDTFTSDKISSLPQENKENITLIWFNPIPDQTNSVEQIKNQLQDIIHYILSPEDIDTCIAHIKSIQEEKIFLLIPLINAYELLPKIINLRQLDSVFIFPENAKECTRLCEDFSKVVGIFDCVDDLIKSMRENTQHVNRQVEVISFYGQHQHSIHDLPEQSPRFLWFQQFKDVIDHLPHDDQAKEEMLFTCQQYYRDNRRILNNIEEFRTQYHSDDCIQWYTKETFIYKLINKALRTEDIEQLYIFRYYIADLSRQLAVQHRMMKMTSEEKKMKLYRGAVLSTVELEVIQSKKGQLFAANGYWSTSRSRSSALTFAKKCIHGSDLVTVLYEIECDLGDEDNPIVFADISYFSEFSTEDEVLFDAGSIFRSHAITKEVDGDHDLYVISVRTSREGRELAREYIEQNRIQMKEEGPRLILCVLLKRMGKSQQSYKFLQRLLENPGNEKLAHIHNRIGMELRDVAEYQDALRHFEKAYKLCLNSDPPENAYAAYILHNQGMVYYKQRKYGVALKHYHRAVTILNAEEGDCTSGIAQFYNSIGRSYRSQGNLDRALSYQRAALEIRESIMPDHAMNAFSYTAIADIYSDRRNYEEAVKYHLKALELRQRLLPPDNYVITWSLHRVGEVYHAMNNLEKARNHYLKSLEIHMRCKSTESAGNIAKIHLSISRTYDYKSEKGLNHRLESWKLLESGASVIGVQLPRLLDDIGFTYKLMGKKEDALQFYQQALKIREEKSSEYSIRLLYSYNNLAYLYESLKDWTSAFTYHREALEIYEHHYPSDHWLCEKTRRSIKRVQKESK